MPSQIGTDLGVALPTPGGDTGTWGDDLNTELQKVIDAVEGGVQTSVGLTVDGAIPMSGYDIEDAGAYFFRDKASAFSTASCIYERDGELYFNDSSGNQVKLTDAGSLNAASVAGIGGDYGGANPASASYNDANSKFIFTSDPSVPATIECGNLRIGRTGETAPAVITLQATTSLAGAYTLTLPTAAAASNNSLIEVSTAGVMAFTKSPTLTNVTATGYVVTSEADIRHGSRRHAWTAWDVRNRAGASVPTVTNDTDGAYVAASTGTIYVVPFMVPAGSRIVSMSAYLLDTAGGSTMGLWYLSHLTDGAQAQEGSDATASASASRQALSISSINRTVGTYEVFFAKFTGLTTGDRLYGGFVTYDKVA